MNGGVLKNLVVDVVQGTGAEVAIAADASADAELRPCTVSEANGRLTLTQMLQIFSALRRAMGIMSHQIAHNRLAQAQPEVVICPRLQASMTLLGGFPHVEQIMAAGEAAAEAALSASECRQLSDRAETLSR